MRRRATLLAAAALLTGAAGCSRDDGAPGEATATTPESTDATATTPESADSTPTDATATSPETTVPTGTESPVRLTVARIDEDAAAEHADDETHAYEDLTREQRSAFDAALAEGAVSFDRGDAPFTMTGEGAHRVVEYEGRYYRPEYATA